MRIAPNLYTNVDASIQQAQGNLQTAVDQLSSGKRVSKPSDDPLAFASDIESAALSANLDQYTKNANNVISQAQMADASLSSVIASLNKAVSLGAQGGDGTLTASQRSDLAEQVSGLLQNVVSQANLTINGASIFGGDAGVPTPFVADPSSPSGFVYTGGSISNAVQVGEGLSVATGLAGDQVFLSSDGSVLGSLQGMVSALTSGNASDIADATHAVTSAIAHVGQVRVTYGNIVNQLTAQNDYMSQETLALSARQSSLVDIDTAQAATNLTQAQTAQSAVLAMAAKILPASLLDYLKS